MTALETNYSIRKYSIKTLKFLICYLFYISKEIFDTKNKSDFEITTSFVQFVS